MSFGGFVVILHQYVHHGGNVWPCLSGEPVEDSIDFLEMQVVRLGLLCGLIGWCWNSVHWMTDSIGSGRGVDVFEVALGE